jgi:hypothetical protein
MRTAPSLPPAGSTIESSRALSSRAALFKETDEKKARARLEGLIDGLLKKLHEEQNHIEDGLQAADLKLLENISLEQHAAASAASGRKE